LADSDLEHVHWLDFGPAALTFVVDAVDTCTNSGGSLDHVPLASSPYFCHRRYAVGTCTYSGGFKS